MSVWIEPKKEDIKIDGDEINIYVGHDHNGNIYVYFNKQIMKDLLDDEKTGQSRKG